METVTIKISGMSCSHCENRVKNALMDIPGVTSAEVSAKSGTAVVTCENVPASSLEAAVDDAGYEVIK